MNRVAVGVQTINHGNSNMITLLQELINLHIHDPELKGNYASTCSLGFQIVFCKLLKLPILLVQVSNFNFCINEPVFVFVTYLYPNFGIVGVVLKHFVSNC